MTAPFTVLMLNGNRWSDITAQSSGPRWRETCPGGFHSASLRSSKRIADLVADDPFNRIFILDSRNRSTLFEGRIEDLGRAVDAEGQWREYSIIGSGGWAQAIKRPYILLDTALDTWEPRVLSPYMRAERSNDPDTDVDALMFSIPQGANTAVSDRAAYVYAALQECGHRFGGIKYTHDSGTTGVARELHFRYPNGTVVQNDTQTTTATTRGLEVTTDFAVGAVTDLPQLRLHVAAASTPTTGTSIWTDVYSIVVKALRKDATGANITTGADYVPDTIQAEDVVNDLLGRWFGDVYDGANASVSTAATHNIDQWAYLDGTAGADMLSDLMALEPGFFWEARDSGLTGLGCSFAWRAWDTSHTYHAEAMNIETPMTYADVVNEVNVRYRNEGGFTRYITDTQSVTGMGFTRSEVIDLADELGSTANATRLASQFLAEHAAPANAGRLTVDRPVYNRVSGRYEMPWEIRTGKLIVVGGITPSRDTLNVTDRNAVTVFRIVGKDVDESGVATLELDTYPRTVSQALKRMARRARKR